MPREAVTMESISPIRSQHLVPAGDIDEKTRDYLGKRMRDHGRTATDLLFAVVLMDHEGTERIAKRIAEGPPKGAYYDEGEARLHEVFPETFFEMEETLSTAALTLASAAAAEDSDGVSQHYSQIVETCVECHTLFTRRVPQ